MKLSTVLSIAALFAATSAASVDPVAPGEPGTPEESGGVSTREPIPIPSGTPEESGRITTREPFPISIPSGTSPEESGKITTVEPIPINSHSGTPNLNDPTSLPFISPIFNSTLPTPTPITPTPRPTTVISHHHSGKPPGPTYYHNTTTTVTGSVTVTDFVTFCPYPTTVTVSTCRSNVCLPHTVTVPEATTLTVTGSCLVPTTYTTETCPECTKTKEPTSTTPGPTSVPSVSEGAAPRNIIGSLAGIVAVAAFLI